MILVNRVNKPLSNLALQFFEAADTDKDGFLTESEFQNIVRSLELSFTTTTKLKKVYRSKFHELVYQIVLSPFTEVSRIL